MRTLQLSLLAASLLVSSGCGVTQVLDRAEDGAPILVRAPQPGQTDLAALHEEYGIRTVINLRGEQPGKSWFRDELRGIEAIGARWVHLPVSGSRPPSDEELETFYDLVEDPDNWPILIHCFGGVHRTGAFAALYRMQYQGWSGAMAVREMEDCYFDWSSRDRSELKEWLRTTYERDPERRIERRRAPRPADDHEPDGGSEPEPVPEPEAARS